MVVRPAVSTTLSGIVAATESSTNEYPSIDAPLPTEAVQSNVPEVTADFVPAVCVEEEATGSDGAEATVTVRLT